MATSEKNLSTTDGASLADFPDCKIGIVTSQWNTEVTGSMLSACKEHLLTNGLQEKNLLTLDVPGSFELPVGARLLDDRHNLDAVICLGCVIKGETRHDEYINQAVANGLTQMGVLKSKPFIFGLLTCETKQQAIDRSGGKHGNKGVEAAATAIQMAIVRLELKQASHRIGFS